ncbi:GntR family transcriptional regulator [Pseudonocardia sp. GCM10023141]|uniref:GntR family transcriptional regulator n=1 Tax=Pseudonocardia sp. GCM10023141 TaxID=3252653 RepID=UPI0036092013
MARTGGRGGETGTARAITAIKQRILRGELLPGEQLRQEKLAADLSISRVPLREALLILADQGLLDSASQQGFVVARRSRAEFAQIHFMLDVLESELLRTIVWPDADTLEYLRALNDKMAALVEAPDWFEIVELNHEFHRVLWDLSTENLISTEVQRIWPLADAYIARGYSRPEHRSEAVGFHDRIIAAIVDQDRSALREISADHRRSTLSSADPTFI